MATWQFSIVFIPRSWVEKNDYNSSKLYNGENYDSYTTWKDNQPKQDLKSYLAKILPSNKSWNKDLFNYGDENSNNIQLWYKNKKIEDIHIRLDLNKSLKELIKEISNLANELDCLFFYPELKYISKANIDELKIAIEKSNAIKFVQNPYIFLENLNIK